MTAVVAAVPVRPTVVKKMASEIGKTRERMQQEAATIVAIFRSMAEKIVSNFAGVKNLHFKSCWKSGWWSKSDIAAIPMGTFISKLFSDFYATNWCVWTAQLSVDARSIGHFLSLEIIFPLWKVKKLMEIATGMTKHQNEQAIRSLQELCVSEGRPQMVHFKAILRASQL